MRVRRGGMVLTAVVTMTTALAIAGPGAAPASAAVAPNLAVDALTEAWQDNSDLGSTGSPQPPPTTTADCGIWSGADGTQAVKLGNGTTLWTFGDTFIGPAVTRQDFFNNSFIRNSMVLQSGSTFTTITGGTGCPGTTTGAKTPVTPPGSPGPGVVDWPASSITYNSNLVKFYYTDDTSTPALTQLAPQVIEQPQSNFESGGVITATSTQLDGCGTTRPPIMWGVATLRATTSGTTYTYIYGQQQGRTGNLFLARTTGDPADQSTWNYYTGGTPMFEPVPTGQGLTCGDITLGAVGSTNPITVATELSVTSVNGNFWLVQEDPFSTGTYPGWAAAHEAANPWSFNNSTTDAVALFQPGVTAFAGINDGFAGQFAYGAKMLDPAAVTASTSGDVVVSYNVNTIPNQYDPGCIPLLDYDANAYRPRFIDVPTADLVTGLSSGAPLATSARPATSGTAPRTATGAVLASSSWTYNPDAVPQGNAYWKTTCPSSYAPVSPNITVAVNSDGSVELSWPNQGADVWYWVHWEDQTDNPVWTKNLYWSYGPNADGWQNPVGAGLPASGTTTIRQYFVPSVGLNGDKYTFWVQAFAAGNGSIVSSDSSSTATTPKAISVIAPTGLTAAVDSTDSGLQLNWTAIPVTPGEQGLYYNVYYKLATATTWTLAGSFTTATADLKPLTDGQKYNVKVAAVNFAGRGPYSTVVSATP